jgi:hypothetical protein
MYPVRGSTSIVECKNSYYQRILRDRASNMGSRYGWWIICRGGIENGAFNLIKNESYKLRELDSTGSYR